MLIILTLLMFPPFCSRSQLVNGIVNDNNTTAACFSLFCDPSISDEQRRWQTEHWLESLEGRATGLPHFYSITTVL
jgi:hypothetical protein